MTAPIKHGTRAGHRHGCKRREDCPANPSCQDAAAQYQRDLRAAHRAARGKPSVSLVKPKTGGIRVTLNPRSPEPADPGTNTQSQDQWPTPDVPSYDAPESLRNAVTEPDPEPANSQGDRYNDPDIPQFVVTPGIQNDIKGKLGLFATVIGVPFVVIDGYCGELFTDNADKIIDKMLPLIIRSPGAVKFFMSTTGGWLDWIAFLQACWPVIQGIYAHHLARSVGRDPKTGRFVKIHNGQVVDATLPPQPDDYAYTAA